MPDQQTIYLNGQYLPKDRAAISVEDRGMLFADGVYEVVRYYNGRPFEMPRHINRLRRSLEAIRLSQAVEAASLEQISNEVVRRNNLVEAKAYWQITRGSAAARTHHFPEQIHPTILVMAYPLTRVDPGEAERGQPTLITARTCADRRWDDCWIKSLMLLPNVLARQDALDAGCDEAIFHREGVVTEASSMNVFIVRDGVLRTHPADRRILPGITRAVTIELAEQAGVEVRQERFTVEQMMAAGEVIACSTTMHVAAVTHIDGRPIAGGAAGPVATQLYRALCAHIGEMNV